MGLFGKKQTAISVFENTYKKIEVLFSKSPYNSTKIIRSDLGPILFLLGDMSRNNVGKDRNAFVNELNKWKEKNYYSQIGSTFDDRVMFYFQFVQGKKSLQFFMSGNEIHNGNFINEMLMAFCDIVRAPELANDYGENSPYVLGSIFDDMTYVKSTVLPLMNIVADYTNEMMRI